jgi:Mn-dependent DtxR family transcriptional regulator
MRTVEEKIFDYMQEHKKPVTSTKMAKYFIASESSVKQALANMVKKGMWLSLFPIANLICTS